MIHQNNVKTYNYLYINIALAAGLIISRFYFQDSLLEKFFRMSFDLTLTLSVVWEGYWIHRLESIKNSKGSYFKNNSQFSEDIIDWQKCCKSIINKFWDYILVFPMLVYFMLTMQWAEFIALIVFQALKAIFAWEIEEINKTYVKFCKNEMPAKTKEETEVQAFATDTDGEKAKA